MNVKFDSITKDLKEAIKTPTEKTKPYDTTAEVLRVEDDIVWVHIAGGVEETPVKKTIDAKKGDTVQVRVSGGNAWITGNVTAPPTDDYTANIANRNAKKAQLRADSASEIANKAQASANGKNTIYYDATQPIATEGGFKVGDTWFNSAEDNAIYRYNGTAWVKEEIGEDAIAELSIKTAHIQDGAITNAKVGNLDAGKITSGTINTNLLDVNGIISVGSIATDSEVSTAKSEAISTASADATTKANDARKYADNYLTTISGTTGISVHDANDTSNYVNISSSAVNIVQSGSNVASFGSTVRVGANVDGQSRVEISSSGIEFKSRVDSSTTWNLANIEFRNAYGNDTIAKSPTFTFGVRGSGSYGQYSFVVGSSNIASELLTTAFGLGTSATQAGAFAEGWGTTASGKYSHAEGYMTTAGSDYQHVMGKYNSNSSSNAFEIGNGSSSARSNALTVDWSGEVVTKGKVITANNTGFDIMASNGHQWSVAWANTSLQCGYGWGSYNNSEGAVYYDGHVVNIRSHSDINMVGLVKISQNGVIGQIGALNSSFFHVIITPSSVPIALYNDIAMVTGNTIGTSNYPCGNVILGNGCSVRAISSAGGTTTHNLIQFTTSNEVQVGNSTYNTHLYGNTVKSTPMVTSSDIRLKTNIKQLGKDTDNVILALDTFGFNFKKEAEENDGRLHYGISAQQLKALLEKEEVDTKKTHIVQELGDYLQVSYTELIPMLIHLCQSQQREIEEIKEKLQ